MGIPNHFKAPAEAGEGKTAKRWALVTDFKGRGEVELVEAMNQQSRSELYGMAAYWPPRPDGKGPVGACAELCAMWIAYHAGRKRPHSEYETFWGFVFEGEGDTKRIRKEAADFAHTHHVPHAQKMEQKHGELTSARKSDSVASILGMIATEVAGASDSPVPSSSNAGATAASRAVKPRLSGGGQRRSAAGSNLGASTSLLKMISAEVAGLSGSGVPSSSNTATAAVPAPVATTRELVQQQLNHYNLTLVGSLLNQWKVTTLGQPGAPCRSAAPLVHAATPNSYRLIGLYQRNNAHAVAVWFGETETRFFDPKIGEVRFEHRDDFQTWFAGFFEAEGYESGMALSFA